MSKSYYFVVALAVICLSVILLSLETDAQPTIDETMTCIASTLEEITNMVKITASNQRQNAVEMKREIKDEINDVKKMLAIVREESRETKNETTLDDAVREIKDITMEIKDEIAEVKKLLATVVPTCVPLVIQQNVDGSNFFNRSWAEFKVGFGVSSGNYWLGNELLSQLTATGRYKLGIELQSRSNGNWYYAEYSTFRVLTEADNYTLQVAGYSGNAGDAFSYHNGMMFSTYDRDNDQHPGNCAAIDGGGFWYKVCFRCGVNTVSLFWFGLPGGRALQSSRMWLQCK